MNLKPSKAGAEPKKLIILGALVLLALYFFWSNTHSGPEDESTPASGGSPAAGAPLIARDTGPRRGSRPAAASLDEFHPSMKRSKDDPIDPEHVDPTLRLDLLAKLREVQPQGGQRSIFDFAAEPPKPVAPVKLPDKKHLELPPQIAGQVPAAKIPSGPPPPPPIPLKFYGFVSSSQQRVAFFLDGEDIVVAGEGDVIKKRYKVLHIGIGSAVVEDQQFKHEQTLPLVAEMES